MPSPKKSKGKLASQPTPSQSRTARSAIPRLTSAAKQLPSRQSARIASSNKRPHPSSSQGLSELNSSSNPRASKLPRTNPPIAPSASHSVDSRLNPPLPNDARLYPSGRRLPTPLLSPADPSISGAASISGSYEPGPRTSTNRHITRRPTPPPREPSVKTENLEDEIDKNSMDIDQADNNVAAPAANGEGDDYGSDHSAGWSYEEYTIPTQRGSPSPEIRYQRSFTKLGQRKPTPRRIILPQEGDLSAMAKTVYYEHDEDQVEPPSPSPNSRRRAVRARERERAGTTSQSVRILDGLDAPDNGENIGEEEMAHVLGDTGSNLFFEYDESGYVYDPRGFEVLEEISQNSSTEGRHGAPQNSAAFDTNRGSQYQQINTGDLVTTVADPVQYQSKDAQVTPPNVSDVSDDTSDSRDDASVDFSPRKALEQPAPPQQPPRTPERGVTQEALLQDIDVCSHEELSNDDIQTRVEDGENSGEMGSTDESFDPDVVILKSGNPKAAAKAAAILRMHHPYVIEDEDIHRARAGRSRSRQGRSPRRHSRTSGQSRSRSRARSDRLGDISMPDLIDEVEVELSQNVIRPRRAISPSKVSTLTPLSIPDARRGRGEVSPAGPTASSARADPSSQPSSSGFDTWTKDDWKNLERCFIQERKVIAQRMQLATSKDVDPSHVEVELVVERFKGFLIASKQFRSGPEWDRRKLILRTSVLAKRLAQMTHDPTLGNPSHIRETATPSTFGDEYDYDRSLTLSRQSSVGGLSNASGLYPQLHAPFTERLQSGSRKISPSSPSSVATREAVPSPDVPTPSSAASKLLGYLGLNRPSDTPPTNSEIQFKQPLPHVPSVLRSRVDSTASPTLPTVPEMSQIRRDGPITLVEPLRRASMGPMKGPEVRIMREREARPILRHAEPPSSRDTSRSRSISIALSQSPNARGLRSVSSSNSVRDLVRGFEELTGETGDGVRQGTPRSQSQGVTPPPRPRWSGGSSSSGSDRKPNVADRTTSAHFSLDDSLRHQDRTFISSNMRQIIVPGRKPIPTTAAPHKKRMSFLGPWKS